MPCHTVCRMRIWIRKTGLPKFCATEPLIFGGNTEIITPPKIPGFTVLYLCNFLTLKSGMSGFHVCDSAQYRPKTTESGEKAPLIKSHLHPLTSSFINKLMDDPDDDLLPQAIHEYFQETAVESVRTLYSHGCLSPDFGQRYSTVFNCVLRLIVRSSAKILLDLKQLQSATSAGDDNAESVHPISQPGHPDVFLRVMKYVFWTFQRALSSASTAEASHSPTKVSGHSGAVALPLAAAAREKLC